MHPLRSAGVLFLALSSCGCLFVPAMGVGSSSQKQAQRSPDPKAPAIADNRLTSYFDAAVAVDKTEGRDQFSYTKVGRLPPDLTWKREDVIKGYQNAASTTHPMPYLSLDFEKASDNKICFLHSDSGMKASDSAEKLGRDFLDEVELATEALADDRKAMTERTIWPSNGPRLDQIEVANDEVTDEDTKSGDIIRKRTITWRICGALPKVGAETKYLAVFMHHKASPAPFKDFGLMLWSIGALPPR